jgi:hypothetical protein
VRAAETLGPVAAGTPLAGVQVVAGDRPAVVTDAAGVFTLSDLPAGLLQLQLSRGDLLPQQEVLAIPAEGVVAVEIALRPAEGARLATISGVIRSEAGAPAAARVSVVELGISAQADARGRFRLELPPGRYTLSVEAPGLVAQRKRVDLVAGEHSIHNLDLQRLR